MVPPLRSIIRVFIVLAALGSPVNTGYALSVKEIRVAIVKDEPSLRISIHGPYKIINSKTNNPLSGGKYLNTVVTTGKTGILIGKVNYSAKELLIRAEGPEPMIVINGRRFRGEIRIIRRRRWHISVVNYIGLEDYIKGILYNEVSHYWPKEALLAQALVCRTYAVYQMLQNSDKSYDVTGDIYSQVYGGMASERYRTNKAVEDTKGEILLYAGRVLPAYYHSTCGGKTEDASLVWNNTDLAALKGVACDFCGDSPHFNWHSVLPIKEMREKLIGSGYKDCGNIKNIVLSGRDISGRITDLRIENDKKDIKITAKDFRNLIGPNLIRSTNFQVNIVDRDAVFEGIGWGHGVGMCQWGAYFMSKQGSDYKQILKYYYPGSEISLIVYH